MKKVGIIGFGNMGSSIMKGAINNKVFNGNDLFVYDINLSRVEGKIFNNINRCSSIVEVVNNADIIFLAVKPQNIDDILKEIIKVDNGKIYVSILAGISGNYIKSKLHKSSEVISVMPNTPIMLGFGATAISRNDNIKKEDMNFVSSIFDKSGISKIIDSDKMNEIIPINGSSPAFIYYIAKVFIGYAKNNNINENDAKELFCNTLIGSAHMMLDTEYSIDQLIDMVCSKGGTTISGLNSMKESGLEDALLNGINDCTKRAYELAK